MKSVFVLLAFALAVTFASAQAIAYNQPAAAIKAKQVLLNDFAFDLSNEQRASLMLAWPNLNFDRKANEETLRDSSLLFVQVEALDQKRQRIVIYKGGKGLVPAQRGSLPKGASVLAGLTVEQGSIKPELLPTYMLALRDMLELGANHSSARHALAMKSDLEWLALKKTVYIDSLHLADFFRNQEGLAKLGIDNVVYANYLDVAETLGKKVDEKSKGLWVTRQLVTYGKEEYVQTYIFNLNKGLQFFVEEPRVKYGSFEIAKNYLMHLFRPERGEPIKDPDLLDKQGLAVQRQF